MPAMPWRQFGRPDPNGDYVALVSFLPLKSFSRLFPFVVYTVQVIQQLAKADGLVGYSLLASPLSKRFWTLSAWTSEEALRTFVVKAPHLQIMKSLRPHMAGPKFVRWQVKGSQLPLPWDEALRKIS
jgi:quinol monooxygenase YgiN